MSKKRKVKSCFFLIMMTVLFVSFITPVCTPLLQVNVEAATVRLNVSNKTLSVGGTYKLKVKNTKKKVKWSSDKKSVATVNSEGKVTARKAGKATITAKVGSKKLKCVITVKADESDEVIRLVNKERKKRGKNDLVKNSYLTAAAKIRAKEIEQYFSHTRPNGTSCFTAVSPKYNYHTLGENIASGFDTPAYVMNGWMHSQGHKENILDDSYTQIGVAVYEKNGVKYWVQVFGSQF